MWNLPAEYAASGQYIILTPYEANFTSYIPQGTHPKLDSIDGAVAPVATEDAGGESDLDFQLAYPIVYPIEVVLYQVVSIFSHTI